MYDAAQSAWRHRADPVGAGRCSAVQEVRVTLVIYGTVTEGEHPMPVVAAVRREWI
jgi:hypothetical protein